MFGQATTQRSVEDMLNRRQGVTSPGPLQPGCVPTPITDCDASSRNATAFVHQSQEVLANCHALSARIAELLVGPEPACPGEKSPPGVSMMQSLEATHDSLFVLRERLVRIAATLGVSN